MIPGLPRTVLGVQWMLILAVGEWRRGWGGGIAHTTESVNTAVILSPSWVCLHPNFCSPQQFLTVSDIYLLTLCAKLPYKQIKIFKLQKKTPLHTLSWSSLWWLLDVVQVNTEQKAGITSPKRKAGYLKKSKPTTDTIHSIFIIYFYLFYLSLLLFIIYL